MIIDKTLYTLATLGIAGLLWVMIQSARAEDPPGQAIPPPGFQPGARPFNNPYAPPPAPPAGDFFEDEGGDEFIPDEPINGGITGGYTPPSNDNTGGGQPQGGPGGPGGPGGQGGGSSGVTVGGGPPNGVISQPAPKGISVDTETAAGCKDQVTDFNYPDADIMDIAKTLGKLLGKNFIFDKDVKGRISIISNAPITCGDAWKAFLTALDMNGFALIPSGNYIRIARQRDARDKQLKTYTGEFAPDTDALITRLFPLKYLSAEEVARNFRSFMPANSRIIPYEQTNTVIVTDTGSNIAKLQKLLEILDIEGYDAGIEVIPVKFASAAELSKLIDTLIPGTQTGGPPGAPRFPGGRFSARRTKEGGIINTIISDERTNTLIVHANNRGAAQVRELVRKLDQKLPSTAGGGKVHVIYLQFAEAEQIANTLNTLSQASSVKAPTAGGTGVNPVQQNLFEGSIKVAADKATNSLVVTASPGDFVTLQRVINKLDIPRDQVFAEVFILEINQGKDFNFSSNFINPKNGIGLITNDTDLKSFAAAPFAQNGAIINFQGGGMTELKINDKTVQVANIFSLIKAIQTNSQANIVATPQILTLDNVEAKFETTEKIPVPTVTSSQGTVTKGITKEDVSLSISIKPQINKISNFVKLDIKAKLEDVITRKLPEDVANSALATLKRNAETSVVVGDGDTVVLGGLTRDNLQETVTKIPILGDIPLLGWLFRSKESKTAKTNLMIFITPKIIRQYENIRAILDKKLRERDEFVEANSGGEDPMRKYRDNMIRGLPDIGSFNLNQPTAKPGSLDSPPADDVSMNLNPPLAPPPSSNAPLSEPEPQAPTPQDAVPIPAPPPPPDLGGSP